MASPLHPQSLGLLIKETRNNAALIQEIAAMLCGENKKTLIRVDKGNDVYISTVFKILNGLGISILAAQNTDADSSGCH